MIAGAVDEQSGSLLTGGSRLDGSLADGYFVAPTVFGDVDHDSSLAREEIFGPVLSVLRFHDEDEVVAKANDSDFGLSAYLHNVRLVARGNASPVGSRWAPSSSTVSRTCRRVRPSAA